MVTCLEKPLAGSFTWKETGGKVSYISWLFNELSPGSIRQSRAKRLHHADGFSLSVQQEELR